MSFCSENIQRLGNFLHLKYIGSDIKHERTTCNCTATITSGYLEIRAVDIRLQRFAPFHNSTGICTDADNSYLALGPDRINCKEKLILGAYQTIYNTSDGNTSISLHIGNIPQMVWIELKCRYYMHKNAYALN